MVVIEEPVQAILTYFTASLSLFWICIIPTLLLLCLLIALDLSDEEVTTYDAGNLCDNLATNLNEYLELYNKFN